RPGTVLVSGATHRFVAALVESVDVGALDLKGKTNAVQAYEVTALRTGATGRGLSGLHAPMVGRDAHLARLRHLFAVAKAGRVSALEIESVKRYVSSLVQSVRALSVRAPVVLVFEDLHWADAASADALVAMMPLLAELPVLSIMTSRNDRDAPGWRLVAGVRDLFGDALTEIQLDPLSSAETRTLVASLLEIESLPAATR